MGKAASSTVTVLLAVFAAVSALASPIPLKNGDFSRVTNGLADGWHPNGTYKVLPKGARNGAAAIELESKGILSRAELRRSTKGGGTSAGVQVVRFDKPREGPFTVSAWMRIDYIGDGGDCCLWLDVVQSGGPPIWGVCGHPDRWSREWQKVTAEVRPSHPVSEIQIYLILRNVPGRVRFSDVRASEGVEPPSVPDRLAGPDLPFWWAENSMTRVFQDDLPPKKPLRRVSLDLARNEREPFQICVRAGKEGLKNVRVNISPLSSGTNRLPGIQWNRVGYVWVEQPSPHPLSPRRTGTWWPDPLLPPREFDVEAGQVQPLWFTVHAPNDSVPGVYEARITISADGRQLASVPVRVTVHKPRLPVTGHMKTAFALMDWHLKKVYGEITPRLRRSYTDFLLQHRLNPDDISRTTLPDLGELEYANTRGLNAFSILNVVPEPGEKQGWVCYAEVNDYTPDFRTRFFERLDGFVPELEKRGLLDKAYVYGFDERGPEYIPIIKDLFGEIKRRYPRIHTLSTCWPPEGTDPISLNIDWYVPLSSSYDPILAAEVRKRGGEMWWYICCGPGYPYANWMLEFPLIEARLIWWQAMQYDVEGFLYWGLNIWERRNNDKPIPDSAGPRLDWSLTSGWNGEFHGDGVLILPGERGPLSTIRLENIRDGLEDTELLRLYRERFGPDKTRRILELVTRNRTTFSRSPENLTSARLAAFNALR